MEVTVHKPHKNRLSLPPRVMRTVSGAVCRRFESCEARCFS
jgi:hypothetical protein